MSLAWSDSARRMEPTEEALLFEFEADLYPRFHCIPMRVRYKLDRVGLKVSLKAWNSLPQERRAELLRSWPVESEGERALLRETLSRWLLAASGEPLREIQVDESAWADLSRLPVAVQEEGERCRPALFPEEWARLELLERVALVKLASSKHERGRFAGALEEFRARRRG